MNKTVVKIFICFTLSAAVIATLLLCINFMGFAVLGGEVFSSYSTSPARVLRKISENLTQEENGFRLTDEEVLPTDNWCILIDASGQVVWQANKPEDIPTQYSINDVARMTRWFLNDYPVYVRTEDYGLLVLGTPKNAVGKYHIEYSMEWFHTLPLRLVGILVLNICLAIVLACTLGTRVYKNLKTLTDGVADLRREKKVQLKENGIFRELSKNINETSAAMERKNAALVERDKARSNWIAGISHDIRTPLSLIMGYSEELAVGRLSAEDSAKAERITAQGIKIKKLIEDINLISSLEYDMQPVNRSSVRLCALLRQVVSDILNSGLSEKFEITFDLKAEKAVVSGDSALLERAFFNLINNSILHNENGCTISISAYLKGDSVFVRITDNGCGAPEEVLAHMTEIPKTAHGLGLPMAYRIFHVHGGKMRAYNSDGFCVEVELPLEG